MKWSSISAAAVALLPLASGAAFTEQQYNSGEVMEAMMVAKEVCDCRHLNHMPKY